MNRFIGTKLVNAKPMNRLEYNKFRGWTLPEDENGDDEGYLVEYVDGGKPNTSEYAGYVSWSPKEQFDNAYRQYGSMTFGQALEAMKHGFKVARHGWNGKGMWICLGFGSENLSADEFWNIHTRNFADENGGSASVLPYFIMKTSDNKILMGWLASQTDLVSEDWEVIGEDIK